MPLHIDPPEKRVPLPLVELPDQDGWLDALGPQTESVLRQVRSTSDNRTIEFISDSAHLLRFFASQWPEVTRGGHGRAPDPDARIVSMRNPAASYGLSGVMDAVRYVSPDRRQIVSFDNEYYGNVKISTRGLCAAMAADAGVGMFVHGTAMAIAGNGVLVGGASGAGKTTITSALRRAMGGEIEIVNDDYGAACPERKLLTFASETRLHMKYRSVLALDPTLAISPSTHLSENFEGDYEDPHARLLIEPTTVFGRPCLDRVEWALYIVVIRDESLPFSLRPLDSGDIELLEKSQYSAFYDRNEQFLDGSLLHLRDEHVSQSRSQYASVLREIPGLLVNNVGSPDAVAEAILMAQGGL